MSLLSGTGTTLPNNIQSYDVRIASFTVASGATGSPYVIPSTTRSYPVNTTICTADMISQEIVSGMMQSFQCVQTTNTTDSTQLELQYSKDGGSTWVAFNQMNLGTGAGSVNKGASDQYVGNDAKVVVTSATAVTSIRFRLVVLDVTSPTTDALTITNIRVNNLFLIAV